MNDNRRELEEQALLEVGINMKDYLTAMYLRGNRGFSGYHMDIVNEGLSDIMSSCRPSDRVNLFLDTWPELKEPYNYDPIIRVGLDALAYAQDGWQLIEIAKHIMVNYSAANAQLCKAIEQGFNPQA